MDSNIDDETIDALLDAIEEKVSYIRNGDTENEETQTCALCGEC